ncbi:hypothetical protein SNEBB_010563 [Seison nebaliae]|nr:hypothetical protein SNEBB_010563 [Seison nebaliae]
MHSTPSTSSAILPKRRGIIINSPARPSWKSIAYLSLWSRCHLNEYLIQPISYNWQNLAIEDSFNSFVNRSLAPPMSHVHPNDVKHNYIPEQNEGHLSYIQTPTICEPTIPSSRTSDQSSRLSFTQESSESGNDLTKLTNPSCRSSSIGDVENSLYQRNYGRWKTLQTSNNHYENLKPSRQSHTFKWNLIIQMTRQQAANKTEDDAVESDGKNSDGFVLQFYFSLQVENYLI